MALTPLNPVAFSPDNVVVALSCGFGPEGHTGLAFHDENGEPRVYHLDGQCVVKFEPVHTLPPCWRVEPLQLKPLVSKQLTVYTRAVVKWLSAINNSVDFGIDFIAARGSFEPDGQYRPPAGSKGLTCASFVTEILRGARISLLQEETWRPSAANEAWGRDLAARFEKVAEHYRQNARPDLAKIYAERATVIRGSVNGLRLMPVEVAGAASLGPANWPVSFDDVAGPADVARRELATVCK